MCLVVKINPMGKLQQEVGILNESDELRALIASCEKALASINPGSVRELMSDATKAQQLLDKLSTSDADVRAEEARLNTVEERMIKNAKPIVAAAGGEQRFVALRQEINPGARERWWLLDEEVAAARRRTIQRIAIALAALVVIGVLGFLFRGVLFPPDPIGDAVYAAQTALRDSNVPKAVQAIDLALSTAPTNTTLLIWKGALLERQNNPASATTFEVAKSNLTEKDFLLEKAQVNLVLGNYDQVIADMTQVINTTPDPAEAHFIRATAYESKNDPARAIQDLETAADIAQRTGNDTLFATARVRMGVLMQNMQGGPGGQGRQATDAATQTP